MQELSAWTVENERGSGRSQEKAVSNDGRRGGGEEKSEGEAQSEIKPVGAGSSYR